MRPKTAAEISMMLRHLPEQLQQLEDSAIESMLAQAGLHEGNAADAVRAEAARRGIDLDSEALGGGVDDSQLA
jgi:hypothetical protein